MEDILSYLDKAFLATEDALPNLIKAESELEAQRRALTFPFDLLSSESISINYQLFAVRKAIESLGDSRTAIQELRARVQKRPYRER